MEGAIDTVAAGFHAAIDALASLPWARLSDADLIDVLDRIETGRRRLETVDQQIIEQVNSRGIAQTRGYPSAAAMMVERLRVSPGEASARVRAANRLGPQRALSGELVERVYPAVSAAQAEGAISAAHAKVIVDTIESLPDAVAAAHDRQIEETLTTHAGLLDPRRLAVAARRLAFLLDQDGQLREHQRRERGRAVEVRSRIDGSARIDGDLSAECAEYLRVMIAAFGQPRSAADGTPDPRSPSQRRHDALRDAMKAAVRTGGLPTTGGVSATLVLTMTDEAYLTGRGTATTGHGYVVPAGIAKNWLGDEYRAIAVLMASTREITAYSSLRRIFSEPQRLAMWARDQHRVESIYYADAHHVTAWSEGGLTSVDNGMLLTRWEHAHRLDHGWTRVMAHGVPIWIPPSVPP